MMSGSSDELETSKEDPRGKFKVQSRPSPIPTDPYNDRIIKLAMDVGYEALITVNGAKANFETPLGEIPRFIIHGGDDRNWRMATSFGGSGGLDGEGDLLNPRETADGSREEVLVKVLPAEGEVIANRQPLIQFDYSKIGWGGADRAWRCVSVGLARCRRSSMRGAKLLSWQVPRKLRNETCQVQVTLRQGGKRTARGLVVLDRQAGALHARLRGAVSGAWRSRTRCPRRSRSA